MKSTRPVTSLARIKSLAIWIPFCALVSLGSFAPREAASEERRGRDEVCVYEHADYGGWEKCYRVGESDRDLGNRRNRISSVRIRGRAELHLYEHPNFQGREAELTSDVPDIGRWRKSWNDEVDSLEVTSTDSRGGGRPDRGRDRVCVYQHVNYQGNSKCWDAGEDIDDLKSIGWNDGISSIRTFGRTRVAVYEDNDFRGERLLVDHDIPDLTRVDANNRSNWNDRISSLRVGGERGERGDDWRDRRD